MDSTPSEKEIDTRDSNLSAGSTNSPTDDMSISIPPNHFTISAHTPDGNISDSTHDASH